MKTYMKSSFYVDFFLFNGLSVCFLKFKIITRIMMIIFNIRLKINKSLSLPKGAYCFNHRLSFLQVQCTYTLEKSTVLIHNTI